MPFVKSQPVDTAADGAIGCSEQGTPHSLLIAPITSEGIALPAEYRVLLYEQTVAQLKKPIRVRRSIAPARDRWAGAVPREPCICP